MSGLKLEGSTTGNVVEVNANNQLQINNPLTSTQAGFASIVCENDAGTVVGSRTMVAPRCSDDYRLKVGLTTPLFDYQFTNTAQDTDFWYYKSGTMTATQSAGFLNLNAISSTGSGNGCLMQTWRVFKVMANAELYVTITINVPAAPLANEVAEFGLFIGTAAAAPGTAPADGAFFRLSNAGLIGVINNAGTETPTGVLISAGSIVIGQSYQLGINMTTYQTEFWNNNTLLGTLPTPAGNVMPFASGALPLCVQQRNSGAVGGGTNMQLKIGSVRVEQDDLALGMPLSHIQAAMGYAYQGLPGGTQGTLSNYTNNIALTPFALANVGTGALTGLGGIAAINPTLAAGTDGVIFQFTNPAGGVAQVPRTLVITGVSVQGAVTTILSNAVASVLVYSLAFGATALPLATAQGATFTTATTKAIKTVPIGIETYGINAAVGTLGCPTPLTADLSQAPICVNPGEFVCLIARQVGTVTSSGAVTVMYNVKHYWI